VNPVNGCLILLHHTLAFAAQFAPVFRVDRFKADEELVEVGAFGQLEQFFSD
jgi:hypothetical protein